MQKFLTGAAAFVIFAAVGLGLLILVTVVIGLIHVERTRSAGIGAAAGAIPAAAVFLVPALCGLLGAFYVLRRLKRAHGSGSDR